MIGNNQAFYSKNLPEYWYGKVSNKAFTGEPIEEIFRQIVGLSVQNNLFGHFNIDFLLLIIFQLFIKS